MVALAPGAQGAQESVRYAVSDSLSRDLGVEGSLAVEEVGVVDVTEVFSPAASLHGEDDEGGGGDVADPPRGRGRAEGDPAEGFEGLQEGVGAFGRGAQGAQEQLWVRLSGQRLAPL